MTVITYMDKQIMVINKIVAFSIGLTMLLTANRSMAGVITLYDGTSGVTPDNYSPQWLNFGTANANIFSSNVGTQTVYTGYTQLDSNAANSIYAGYSNYNVANPPTSPTSVITPTTFVNPSFPTLDRNLGYNLTFTVRINSQTNDGTNGDYRAGFSIIALSSDKKGIEIGFRNDDIFSQNNSAFNSIGEQKTGVSNQLLNETTYNLNVLGENYTLTSGGTTLLSGFLRDYTTASGFGSDVYRTSNFLFLGDNTTSARANVDIRSIGITTNTATVPYEFSPTIGILALVAGGAVKQVWKKKK
jgi:hypothetical protein